MFSYMAYADSGAASSAQTAPETPRFPAGLPVADILESIGDAVALFDPEWRFRYVNGHAETLARRSAAELLDRALWDLFPDLSGAGAGDALRRTMLERVSSHFEHYYAPGGLWLEADAHPVQDGVVLFARDITTRKRAEEQNQARARDLERRVQEFETLLDLLPVGIAVASDPECRDIRPNRAMAALLGTDPGVNVSLAGPGRTMFRAVRNGRELALSELPLQIAAREGREVRDVEFDVIRSDGQVRTELCFAQPLFDELHKVRGSIVVALDATERRRAERALQQSEANYRFLAEALPQFVWIATPDDRIVYINSHWLAYTGLTLEESRAGVWHRLIHPDDLPGLLGRAAEGREKETEAEYRLRRASDGMYRWHLGRSRIVTMADGSECWLGTAMDIHDRKQAEQQHAEALHREQILRRQSEEALERQQRIERQLLLLVEASGTLIASPESSQILDGILRLARSFVGAGAYAVWRRQGDGPVWKMLAQDGLSEGYRRTVLETEGQVPLTEYPAAMEDVESAPLVQAHAEIYRQEGIRSMLTMPLTIHGAAAGTIVFYYRAPHRFNDLEMRLVGGLANLAAAALGTAEIHERQTALRLLAESAERRANFLAEAGKVLSSSLDYETTLASVADLAVPAIADWVSIDIVDDAGEVRRVALKHMDPARVALGEEYARRFPPDESGGARQALRTGKSVLVEEIPDSILSERIRNPEQLAFLRALGLTSLIIAPLVTSGRILGVLTFVNAESGRRYTASDLLLAEELAARAAIAVDNARLYREQKTAQETLRRINTELKRANEDLNQFAYSASHDLREPLRMIAIYSQMLDARCGDGLDEDARTFLSYMRTGARRMDMLVTDILAYTQAASIFPDRIAAIAAEAAMDKAVANLTVAIGETGAGISRDPLPELMVHEAHLIQLFQNLIGNAIKYRGEAPPRIHVSAEPAESMWKISIRDNGIGIAPEYFAMIFGIFTRLHSADKYSGTGIGLAICLKIVERYGGKIGVDSEEGKGSTFWLTLPGVTLPGAAQ